MGALEEQLGRGRSSKTSPISTHAFHQDPPPPQTCTFCPETGGYSQISFPQTASLPPSAA
eukprot:1151760-Pelagomonas_calceolata.AAC.12